MGGWSMDSASIDAEPGGGEPIGACGSVRSSAACLGGGCGIRLWPDTTLGGSSGYGEPSPAGAAGGGCAGVPGKSPNAGGGVHIWVASPGGSPMSSRGCAGGDVCCGDVCCGDVCCEKGANGSLPGGADGVVADVVDGGGDGMKCWPWPSGCHESSADSTKACTGGPPPPS